MRLVCIEFFVRHFVVRAVIFPRKSLAADSAHIWPLISLKKRKQEKNKCNDERKSIPSLALPSSLHNPFNRLFRGSSQSSPGSSSPTQQHASVSRSPSYGDFLIDQGAQLLSQENGFVSVLPSTWVPLVGRPDQEDPACAVQLRHFWRSCRKRRNPHGSKEMQHKGTVPFSAPPPDKLYGLSILEQKSRLQ